jgi:MoaA/NifB/PqqE/SkfB family radical SAM enzyme
VDADEPQERCAMCLWSDKTTLTYATRGLKARGLLSTQQWLDAIEDLRAHGVQTLVISGGGEALLNPDLPAILRRARNLGLRTQLYTTGFNLRRAAPDLWEEIARTHRVRLSIHSPIQATYAQITGLPTELHPVRRVREHAQRLLDLRDRLGSPLRLGIGFVLMAVNHGEILAMADFAAELGADFLDIRKDEVDVTDGLSADQRVVVRRQLVELRSRARPATTAVWRWISPTSWSASPTTARYCAAGPGSALPSTLAPRSARSGSSHRAI